MSRARRSPRAAFGDVHILCLLAALAGSSWLLLGEAARAGAFADFWAGVFSAASAAALAAAVQLAAAFVLWRSGVARRHLLAGGLAIAALLAGSAYFNAQHGAVSEAAMRAEIAASYDAMWRDLETLADRMVPDLEVLISEHGRTSLFDYLRQLIETAEEVPGLGVLLFDADGEAVSWHGAGLLHEPAAYELPPSGRTYRRGFTAVTALLVRPIGGERRPWRVVLGRSLAQDTFPFSNRPLSMTAASTAAPISWSLGAADDAVQELPEGIWRFTSSDAAGQPGPALYVNRHVERGGDAETSAVRGGFHAEAYPPKDESERGLTLTAWLARLSLFIVSLIAAAAGLVVATDGSRALEAPRRDVRRRVAAVLACLLGTVGMASATGASSWALLALALAVTIASSSLAFSPVGGIRRGFLVVIESAGLWLLAWAGLAWLARGLDSRTFLAPKFSADALWLALAVALLILARLVAISPSGSKRRDGRWLFLSLLSFTLGAAFHDQVVLGLLGGALGSAAAAWWWRSLATDTTRPRRFATLTLIAALAGSLAWHTAYRDVLRHDLEAEVLPSLAPPEADELNELLIELHGFFDGLDIERVAPPPGAEIPESLDLPYALWRRSPLTHHDGLSAVMIEDDRGRRHLFSFGLAFGSGFDPLPSPARWPVPDVPAWREAMIQGDGRLLVGEQAWGRVRFWYLPRPGFRRQVDELRELGRNLVRGKPRHETADGLPEGVRYALYDHGGEARSSPWDEAPPLAADVVSGAECGRRTTPDGDSWCWTFRGTDGFEALYLPVLGPQAAFERVGAWTMALFPLLVLLGALAFAGAARSSGLLELWHSSMRSYSRRLALVFTLLLLVPLIALNLVLLRSVAERLRNEQLADARDAMVSARTLLLDYLRGLEPGFLIETQVNRELLDWIGGLVGHQVNLYWGSRLYASSQQELFTAGLLPRRIPGEIYTRLSLFGYDLGFRRQRAGDLAYLEVYAPIDVPGIVSSQQGLFLSVPLLEQEEAAGRELAAMQSRAILVSSALLLLTLAVAGRLSRRFTEPIVQLIEGTRRIARGESYDPVKPRETELMALARAIDEMAEQVSAGRRGLEREKHFVERVVANISSGVVSLDRERRVVLHNRIARELLGSEIGELLGDVLAKAEHFAPVRAFLEQADDLPLRRQVKLRPAGERVDVFEWSLTWVPIPGAEDPAALLVVDDATEVMRGQRLETWAEMARIIAHEIKNPLTPIQLSTEHMQQVYKVDPDRFGDVLARCSSNILRNVAELRLIASEFSTYSRIPDADLTLGDLVASIRALVANYQDAPGLGVQVDFATRLDSLEVRFDQRLIGRAVRNLVENALRETAPEGGSVRAEVDLEVAEGQPEWALVRVIDSGPGVDPQKLERIFEPYFSTYESGTGLGLAITRRIVEEHGGTIEARNRPGGGLMVIIRIPRTSDRVRPTMEQVP